MTETTTYRNLVQWVVGQTFPGDPLVSVHKSSERAKRIHLSRGCPTGSACHPYKIRVGVAGGRLCPRCALRPDPDLRAFAAAAHAVRAARALRTYAYERQRDHSPVECHRLLRLAGRSLGDARALGVEARVADALERAHEALAAAAAEQSAFALDGVWANRLAATWMARTDQWERLSPPEARRTDGVLQASDIGRAYWAWVRPAILGDLSTARAAFEEVATRIADGRPSGLSELPLDTELERGDYPDLRSWLEAAWQVAARSTLDALLATWERRRAELLSMSGELLVIGHMTRDRESVLVVRDLAEAYPRQRIGEHLLAWRMPALCGRWLADTDCAAGTFRALGDPGVAAVTRLAEITGGLFDPAGGGACATLDGALATAQMLDT